MTTLVRLKATLVAALVLPGTPAAAGQSVGSRHAPFEPGRPPALQVQVGAHPVSQGATFRPLALPPRKPEASPTTLPEFINPLKRRRMALPAADATNSF